MSDGGAWKIFPAEGIHDTVKTYENVHKMQKKKKKKKIGNTKTILMFKRLAECYLAEIVCHMKGETFRFVKTSYITLRTDRLG